MKGRVWTEEEEIILTKLIEEGHTRNEIVKIVNLDRSDSSIYQRVSILEGEILGTSKKSSPISIGEQKEQEGIKKSQIEQLKKKFHIGQNVYGVRYSTLNGKHSPGVKIKGVVVGIYPHMVRVKSCRGHWTECFDYRDLILKED